MSRWLYVVFAASPDVYCLLQKHLCVCFIVSYLLDVYYRLIIRLYKQISQELRECGVKRPPPLREDEPWIVGGAIPETIPATTITL